MRSWAWLAISAPWSRVSERRSWAGKVMIVAAIASRTASAPCPASAGPFLARGMLPWPFIGGRCSSIVNRVVRPARVPIADLFSPMIRSPSVRLSVAREGRVWLRSPCVVVAYWECPPGPPRGALAAD